MTNAQSVSSQSEVNMLAVWAETDGSLHKAVLSSGSTSDEANIKFRFFFHRRHKVTRPSSLTVERGDGVAVHDVHTDLCKSFRVTDTMGTTPCGNQRRDTVDSISNSYQRRSGFTSLTEFWLSQLMVLWSYSVVLRKCRGSFSKEASRSFIHVFSFFSLH
jgi:hypothetical protein